MKLKDLNIYDVGDKIGMVGAVFGDEHWTYLCMFPTQEAPRSDRIEHLEMGLDDWAKFLKQLDVQETEVLQKAPDGKLIKAILRKTQRTIEQRVSWAVYKRDNYRCRYCHAEGVPLTVDHLVLWEEGGPSVEENLVAACRKCNRTRGNTQYADWLQGEYYRKASRNLPMEVLKRNEALIPQIDRIVRRYSERTSR